MSVELPKYNPNRKCAKCGYAARTDLSRPDRIRRTCGRCGYVWFERTLDAEEQG